MERRAKAACEAIAAAGHGVLEIEWRKSRDYGLCPAVIWQGQKAAHASGCGYDKLSAVLASFLRFLDPEAWRASGAGVRSVQDRMAAAGWTLEHTANGRAYDVFTLTRTTTNDAPTQ